VVRTLVWGKSAAPIQHNAGLCKVRAVANQVGLVPATATSASRALLNNLIGALALAADLTKEAAGRVMDAFEARLKAAVN